MARSKAKGAQAGGGSDGVDAAFRLVERVTAIGATIGGLEMLRIASSYRDDGLNAWPITRTRLRGLTGSRGRIVDRAVRYPRVLGVAAVRALSGAALLLPRQGRAARAAALGGLVGSGAMLHLRSNFGNDGSDHFAVINFGSALIEKAFPHDPRAREAALAFIAAQSCLSYFVSGAVKLRSPVWRSGEALTGILRTKTYGDAALYRVFRDRPRLARAACWAVMLFEVTFPLVLIAPRPVATAILGGAVLFHVVNARFMGLNRFLWSFTGSYPAVAYFARGLRRDGAPTPALVQSVTRALTAVSPRG
jgi:hypothetical protein